MKLLEKIAEDLQLDLTYVINLVKEANRFYKQYRIPKRNGGSREVQQASPELKSLQYWVKENILNQMPISRASYAYSKNSSIKKHALYHAKSHYVLHADIKNFFPNIHSRHLEKQFIKHLDIFANLGLDIVDAIATISKICFRKDSLCIGTVSSPSISNIVMYDLDNELIKHCQENRYLFSRYADDIYISSQDYIPIQEKDYLANTLNHYGFELNYDKTYFSSKKGKRSVTGIILTDESGISIGVERKLQIKKMLYNKLKHGVGNANEILGHLAFLKDIEPFYYNKLITKYSTYCEDDILTELKK